MIARAAFFLTCLASLPALASQDLDRQAAAHIARLVISDPGDPGHVAIRDPDIVESKEPELGNRIASWISGGDNHNNDTTDASVAGHDLDRILESRNVHLGADLRAAVANALTADGYRVTPEPSYDTDASLNLTLRRIRYNGVPFHERVTAEIVVDANLVDLNSHAVLYSRTYMVSDTEHEIGDEAVAPDPAYVFAGYNDVVADPERAVAGLRANFALIAKAIGRDLAR